MASLSLETKSNLKSTFLLGQDTEIDTKIKIKNHDQYDELVTKFDK